MVMQQVYRHDLKNQRIVSSEEPVPMPEHGQVLIKVDAVALNYRDVAINKGVYPFPVKENPIVGSDVCGTVVSYGAGVEGVKEGDTVISSFDIAHQYGPLTGWEHGLGGPIDGTLRQYIALPASALVRIPSGTTQTPAELASLVCTGTTAWNALFSGVSPIVKPGQTILVQGTGGVSLTALAIARAAGVTTIVTSSSDEKLALVKARYGAEHTINYKTTPDWAKEALKFTRGEGVDLVIENGGSGTIAQSIEATKMGGATALIGFLSQAEQKDMPDVATLALLKGITFRGINIGSKQLLEELVRFVAAKDVHIPVDKVFPFTEVAKAFDYVQSGQHIGKVAIRISS